MPVSDWSVTESNRPMGTPSTMSFFCAGCAAGDAHGHLQGEAGHGGQVEFAFAANAIELHRYKLH